MPAGTELTRRRLLELGIGGGLTLAAVRLVAAPIGAPSGTPGITPHHLRRSAYTALVGERFTIRPARGARPVAVRLEDVRDLGRGRPALRGHEDGFALRFHGPRSPRLDQGVHALRHPALGRFELLLAPSGTGRAGQDYEAVVNRVPRRT
jgi:hypothetical protein